MGDFNIDLLKSHANNVNSKFLEVMASCFYVLYIQQTTHVVGSSATLIENIFMNFLEFVTVSGNLLCQLIITIYCNSLFLKISRYLTG